MADIPPVELDDKQIVVNQEYTGTKFQDNGTVGAAPATTITATVNFKFKSLFVRDTHAGNNLLISFDGGTKWTTIYPGEGLNFPLNQTSVQVKGSAAGTTWEAVGEMEATA